MVTAITLENVNKQYPGAEEKALDSFSLSIGQGSIAGLLGPNGAGKTTTFSMLCGMLTADSGSISVLGLDAVQQHQEIKKKIGVVPQQIALFPQLTGWENFEYIGKLYKIPKSDLQEKIQHYLSVFDLTAHKNKRIQHYSGGMKRRANIIASILHEPDLLILDEPTAGVDVQSRAMILDFLKTFNQQGKTILYTSHLLEEAERICDQVAIIDNGKLIVHDKPQTLIQALPDCRNLEDVFLHYTGRNVRE